MRSTAQSSCFLLNTTIQIRRSIRMISFSDAMLVHHRIRLALLPSHSQPHLSLLVFFAARGAHSSHSHRSSPCAHGLHSGHSHLTCACGQGGHREQNRAISPCSHSLHAAQFIFGNPWKHGLHSTQ